MAGVTALKSGKSFGIELSGRGQALEALSLVNESARLAQRSAIRAAGVRAASLIVKKLAGFTGTVAKVWRKRVSHFPGQRTKQGLSTRRVWLGLKYPPKAGEHASVARVLSKAPGVFEATMKRSSGYTGLFRRRYKTIPYGPGARKHPNERRALPIDEGSIDVSGIAEETLLKAGTEAMKDRYVEVLEKELKRRLKRTIIKKRARK